MFRYSSNLSYLDISSFKTPFLESTVYMFQGYISLTSLNFPNFNASIINNCYGMFANCTNLKYINFSNSIDNNNINYKNILALFGNDLIVCINKTKAPNLYSILNESSSTSIDCLYIYTSL